ncbi:MAG: hypothetical protein PHO28_00460 [Candidatus Pacebacteria bacterium]|nr:hypothetical protein [Candidatus Paceibacterota bacterium]
MKKISIFLCLLIIILLITGWWYWQKNYYSKEILKLEILGPDEAETSQEIEYTVRYKNNGNIRLDDPLLIFEFPEYSIPSEGFSKRHEIGTDKLGDSIYPGEEKSFVFKGRLFGKEGDVKKARVVLSYKPKDLKTRYESETSFTTVIKKTPITFDFDFPSKIESGKNFKFYLNYFSNSDYPLSNLGIKINYPDGFEFISSNPKSIDKIHWDIPILNKTEGGRIEINAKISGEVKEQKIFRAYLGVWVEDQFIILKEISKGIEISKPNLLVFQRINNQNNYIASPGELLHYEIFFRNMGDEPFNELFLVSKLEGDFFDFSTLRTQFGQFNKEDNSILWDWRDVDDLYLLEPGKEGKVEFWIKVKDVKETDQFKNFTLRNTVSLPQIKEIFETKVSSKLVLHQKGYYYDEIFGNSGPLPLKVNEKTTYTIIWEIKNYLPNVENIKVRATLPSNVFLTGKIWPESEKDKITFDSASKEIVWSVSNNPEIKNKSISIAFQVYIIPKQDQINQIPVIINEAKLTGEDQFTGTLIESIASAITADLPDDLQVNADTGKVIQ